ncbi:MAG: GPR endopeptidase [Lachnospiraceae bacterium]|nr:GPR endopeptidase [Lachnospiraceae bacterium]MDD7026472.1 GPR endopeptidase [Lachnospiraceae bacterium]MDY5701566.1 GPR endopeptidase [Lachnospiraceae bacterium]
MAYFQVRTDLALEAREFVEDANGALRGVIVEEYDTEGVEIHVTRVQITTKNGAKMLGKPMGTYVTLEVPQLSEMGENSDVGEQHRLVAQEISNQLKELLPKTEDVPSVLIVGLGNRDVTADALGPEVVEHLCITRHMIKEYGKMAFLKENTAMVSSMVPGVMAKTGMETAEIVAGIVSQTQPDVVIVVDALAARSTKRLNRTIQISNTGIHPGSGVGNHRNAITQEVLGIPVIAMGVPTVVDAATIVGDALERMHREMKEAIFLRARDSVSLAELNNMYVTAKDIDATIKRLSFTLAEALNMTFTQE